MIQRTGEGSLLSFLDTFSGGSFSNATIFAMSITPYVNASIIMNLLTVAIPALERLSKEGEEGRKKIAQWSRYVTVVLGFIQAVGLYFTLSNARAIENPGWLSGITIVITFTAGTAFLMWLGEQINEKGIGNGISLLIFAGIVSRGPVMVSTIVNSYRAEAINMVTVIGIVVIAIVVIAAVVAMNNAERRIPVSTRKE